MYSAKHVHGASRPPPPDGRERFKMANFDGTYAERKAWQKRMYNAKHIHGASTCYNPPVVGEPVGDAIIMSSKVPARTTPPTRCWSQTERKEWQFKMYHAKHVHGVRGNTPPSVIPPAPPLTERGSRPPLRMTQKERVACVDRRYNARHVHGAHFLNTFVAQRAVCRIPPPKRPMTQEERRQCQERLLASTPVRSASVGAHKIDFTKP